MQTSIANIISPPTEGLPRFRQWITQSPCGSGFASCVLVIATLLFGINANAAQLPADNCLFNWAESNYPSLFVPTGSATVVGTVYTYRYYPATNAYLGVSSFNHNVYYLGPDGNMQNEGPVSDWLAKAGCPVPAPPLIDCLFNWAEGTFPILFGPAGSITTVGTFYTFRYYSATDTNLAVSSVNNHVYYQEPNGNLVDEGPISDWLPMAGCQNAFPAPSYPVIFIHGLNSSALAWAEPGSSFKDFLINNGGWIFGGSPTYDSNTKRVNGILGSGDFYTLNFSNNPYSGFDVNGSELSAIIQAVLSANPGMSKVILVAHSMGGLAAREYLQGLSTDYATLKGIPYRGDVYKLITVGTPHQGSYMAEICSTNSVVCKLLGYDPSNAIISELRPRSAALNTLNNLQAHPLPSTVSYFSILGTGADTLSSLLPPILKDGDFLVTAVSQDISKVSGTRYINPKSVTLGILDRGVCDYGGIAVLHLCETGDIGVWAAVLLDL